MIIIYNKPNTLSLPYNVIKEVELRDKNNIVILDSEGNPKMTKKNVPEYFKFVPGRNNISPELWTKITQYNVKDWDYYSTILKVFKPVSNNEETGIEIGEDEEKIEKNIKDLKSFEFKDLIENTMDVDTLKRYYNEEKKRDKPRQVILKAIKARKTKIDLADKALSKKG